MNMNRLLMKCAALIAALAPLSGFSQTPQFSAGQVLTAGQLNAAFASVLPLSGGSLTGPLIAPSLTSANATITGGSISGTPIDFGSQIKSGGQNGISVGVANVSPGGNQGPVFVGPAAGASYTMSNPGPVGLGAQALMSLSQPWAEVTAVGTWAGRYLTTGNYSTAIGMNALGAETTGSYFTAIGNDSMRNEWGGSQSTAVGTNSMRNGAPQFSGAYGFRAMYGNGVSLTFGGTPTVGDVVSVQMSSASPDVTNSPHTVTYTVKTGDTLTSIAQGVASAINASPLTGTKINMQALVSAVSGGPPAVALDFPGTHTTGWAVTVTPSVSGAATETISVGNGAAQLASIAIGQDAMFGAAMGAANYNIAIGFTTFPFVTSGSQNICLGTSSCFSETTGSRNLEFGFLAGQSLNGGTDNVLIGDQVAKSATAGNDNVVVGSNAGNGMTSGNDNVIVGGNAGATGNGCITSGSNNVQIGRSMCVPSPTATGQMSIQNIIYGTGNNGAGSTVSSGNIGIGSTAPAARLEVKGIDTSAGTSAFRVTDSTGKNLLKINDDGSTLSGAAAVANVTGLMGNQSNQQIYSVPANGFYCVSAYNVVTTAATTSSTLPNVQILWTDADSSAVPNYSTTSNTGNTAGTYNSGQVCIYAKGGTSINYQTSGYASSGATSMAYAVHVRVYYGAN
ncbi:LysM peptidoglycan-binding domain-containing protein [Burkholderia seminalis]|uniref:LysM peptidoglycan-binding domain-containing protein n=1 Tax=Burkholderia seminalis TaxID=488731 RepID=UPI001CF50B01|nr:LysM peptidoglycan-binding domain-containing protein [Burkholderia seminalis]MCA7953836.1 LysM peptidoglycan-binding domain-containing protein [Burkholderia seminalis]